MTTAPILISGGTLVTAEGTFGADVLLDGGRVAALGHDLSAPAGAERLDARDLLVMPGFIDAHTHLDMPMGDLMTADDWATGTEAAAAGGTTTIIDMAVQRVGDGLAQTVEAWEAKAAGKAVIDYGFHLVLTDPTPAVLAEIPRLPGLGVASVKLFMAYVDTPLFSDDGTMLRVLQLTAGAGLLTLVHAENGPAIATLTEQALARGDTAPVWHARTRPPATEAEAAGRAIRLAQIAGAPLLVVHISCADALEEVLRARRRGAAVFGETCPQYVAFDVTDLEREGFEGAKYVCSPPLRDAAEQPALWQALAAGDIDLFSSDHCPFDFATGKVAGREDFSLIPNGMAGIEERASVLWTLGVATGAITPERFVAALSTNQARVHGMLPRKGIVAPGADADVVLWDPRLEIDVTHANRHGAVDHSPYEGMRLRGAPAAVYRRGELVYDGHAVTAPRGSGAFVRRAAGGGACR
jgi:dihydropyrimidinase